MTVERPDLDLVAGVEREQRVVVELVLLDLVAEQAAGQGARVDRHARELGQDVRQAADVVLVGVGDQERLDVGAALLEVGDVGDDEVDAEHLLVGEHEPAVDDDDVVAVLEDVHVLADLAHPAERDDAERRMLGSGIRFLWIGGWKRVSWVRRDEIGRGRRSADDGRGPERVRCRRSVRAGAVATARRRAEPRGRRRRFARGARAPLARGEQRGRHAGDVVEALALDRRRAQRGRGVVHREHERVAGAGRRIGRGARAVDLPDPRAGHERPIEYRPSVTTTAGSSTSSWRRRYGAQAAISSGCGSRLSGGRHLTTLVMNTSSRPQPIDAEQLARAGRRRARRTAAPRGPR